VSGLLREWIALLIDAHSVIDSMRRLVEKYPEGYEGWARDRELAQKMENLTS
jgi:hypothetical protein